MQPWRPVWNTWTLVLPTAGFAWLAGVMLAKSLSAAGHESAGPALSVLKKAEEKTGETASEPLWESTRLAALAPLVVLACYFAAASTDASARTALASLLTGANAWLFWAGVIVPSVLLSFLAAQFASDTLKRNPVLGIALATLSAFAAGAWQHLVLGLA